MLLAWEPCLDSCSVDLLLVLWSEFCYSQCICHAQYICKHPCCFLHTVQSHSSTSPNTDIILFFVQFCLYCEWITLLSTRSGFTYFAVLNFWWKRYCVTIALIMIANISSRNNLYSLYFSKNTLLSTYLSILPTSAYFLKLAILYPIQKE